MSKIAAAYIDVGYRVGVFTSSHLHTLREHIQINNARISAEDLEWYSQQVLDIEHTQVLQLHFFEIMTAVAFRYFPDEAVDLALFEVVVPVVLGPSGHRTVILKAARSKQSAVLSSHHVGYSFDDENSVVARRGLEYLRKIFPLMEENIKQGLKRSCAAPLELFRTPMVL